MTPELSLTECGAGTNSNADSCWQRVGFALSQRLMTKFVLLQFASPSPSYLVSGCGLVRTEHVTTKPRLLSCAEVLASRVCVRVRSRLGTALTFLGKNQSDLETVHPILTRCQ